MMENRALILFLLAFMFFGCGEEKKHKIPEFTDLSKDEQAKYIAKSDLNKFSPYLITAPKQVEIGGEPINGDNDELKAQIETLRVSNQKLFADNVELTNKNLDLVEKFKELGEELKEQQKAMNAKNTSVLNEIEKQHYKNINDLTQKINDLQKENVQNIKSYEQKIVELQNKADAYENNISQAQNDVDTAISQAIKGEKAANYALGEQNRILQTQIDTLKSTTNTSIASMDDKLSEKKEEIVRLKDQISAQSTKINELLSSHTNEILELQTKNSNELAKLQNEIKTQRDDYLTELGARNDEIKKFKSEFEAYKIGSENALKSELEKLKKQEQENAQIKLNSLKNAYEAVIDEQNKNLAIAKGEMLKNQSEFTEKLKQKDDEFAKTLAELNQKAKLASANGTTLKSNLDANISYFSKELENKEKTLAKLQSKLSEFSDPDDKTKINYSVLNSEITRLSSENLGLKDYVKGIDSKIETMKTEAQNKLNSELENQKKYYEEMISTLKNPQSANNPK